MISSPISLFEYETTRLELSDSLARRIIEGCRGALLVEPDPTPGWWRITAANQVGTLVIDDLRILIRPKIRLDNLFLMLEAGLPAGAWGTSAYQYSSSQDLLPAVVAFFARTAETTLAGGPLHSYRDTRESLVAPRGRLDIPAQLGRAGLHTPVACRFDEYTSDVPENRYLKAALRRALRVPSIRPEDRRRLQRSTAALVEVSDHNVHADSLDRIVMNRLNAYYGPALHLARLILQNLTLVDEGGRTPATTFLVDMNDLFQRFTTGRLRLALRERVTVLAEPVHHLAHDAQITLLPDLVFTKASTPVLVGDLKYKIADTGKGRTPDYYQLLAYTTALNLSDGVLIYCGRHQIDRPSTSVVLHAGKRLHTWALDLTGSATEVAHEIASLAEWIATY